VVLDCVADIAPEAQICPQRLREPKEKQEGVQQWIITGQHYKTVSEWLERLGLVVVASLVMQKIVIGASLSDLVVIIGSIGALVIYAAAVVLLLRS
jgi:hypothetical protein